MPSISAKTCTKLGSLSSPTRDGENEIQIDDIAGRQRIRISAEKDQNIGMKSTNEAEKQFLKSEDYQQLKQEFHHL